jgi:hypothetical protein
MALSATSSSSDVDFGYGSINDGVIHSVPRPPAEEWQERPSKRAKLHQERQHAIDILERKGEAEDVSLEYKRMIEVLKCMEKMIGSLCIDSFCDNDRQREVCNMFRSYLEQSILEDDILYKITSFQSEFNVDTTRIYHLKYFSRALIHKYQKYPCIERYYERMVAFHLLQKKVIQILANRMIDKLMNEGFVPPGMDPFYCFDELSMKDVLNVDFIEPRYAAVKLFFLCSEKSNELEIGPGPMCHTSIETMRTIEQLKTKIDYLYFEHETIFSPPSLSLGPSAVDHSVSPPPYRHCSIHQRIDPPPSFPL